MCLQCGRPRFHPGVGKIPWRRERLHTPAFWPREFHALYSPPGRKELDMTERLSLSKFFKQVRENSEVAQSCPTLCHSMDCSLSGSSVRGIFQARVLEWIAISFSRGSFQPRNRTQVSRIAGRRFTSWATREAKVSVRERFVIYSFREQVKDCI